MDVEDLALNPAELIQEGRRREMHAAHARWVDSPQAKQMLMPYRNKRNKLAAIEPGFEFKPGFIYTQVRAISARINQNYDAWPSEELKKSYRTFIGKPCFVNHQNFDYKKARGKVVAARYIESGDDRYVETVMEIDAQRFPKLAHEIKTGGLDSVSMGVEAGFTKCSICDNKAVDVPEFCAHVKYHKGSYLPHVKTGRNTLVYENCYKLGFFELSYVFDPADETAVVSRVIAANNKNAAAEDELPPNEIQEGQMPTGEMPTHILPTAALERRIERMAYGEIQAPEDVDTLRDESEDDTDDFKSYVKSPEELRAPNLDRTQQLDRSQETEGLDTPRRVEQVEDVGGHFTGQDPVKDDRHDIEEIKLMAAHRGPATLVDPRTGRRYYAADEEGLPPELMGDDPSGGGEEGLDEAFPPEDGGGEDYSEDGGGPEGGGQSDEELLQEAEADLQQAEAAGAGHDPTEEFGDDGGEEFGDEQGADSGDDFPGDDGEADAGGGEDLPPWLTGGDEGLPPEEEELPPREARRRRANNQKGRPMSLSQRNRVASAGRRRHYAEEGHTDGGPYGNNDEQQGEGEQINEVYGDGVPSSEAVAAPGPGDGTISNTENTLVARRLQKRIQARNAELRRDLIAYEQVTGKRIGSRKVADDGNWPNPSEQSISGAESPDKVDPALSGTDEQGLKGDFDDIALDNVNTAPSDKTSARYFQAFDTWLQNSTGKTARQHGNPNFIRRSAAQFCSAKKISVESLFPTLGSVLREARKNERSANMKRRAVDLDTAAPQDRIDVEAPVSNVTDADAQASQYSSSDFGDNAGDNLVDPELSTDSQIWAPGEGDSAASSSKKDANRKADGITAVRYAEAYIQAGLAPNTPDEKWKIAGMAQMMRHATIVDRIGVLDAVNSVNRTRQASARRTAGVNSGPRIPQGLSNRQVTAGTSHTASNDTANDFALFMKG